MTSYTSQFEKRALKDLSRLASVFALTVLFGNPSNATPPPSGVAPVTVPAGGFAIDGDLMGNGLGGDWVTGTNAGSGVLSPSGAPLNPATTFHYADPYNTSADSTFGGGLKWTDDPNTWQWTSSKPSSKTDINNVLFHTANDASGHTWTMVAADRASTSGDSYIDFEFLQNTLIKTNNGKFVSSGPNGGRTVNDLLLSLAFTSGGSTADFLAFRWLPNGSGGYAYQDVTAALPTGRVFVALNTNAAAVPYGAFGATTYSANAFAEAALDLTALLGGFDPCLSMGFKTIMVKTKSSPSSTATIGDFIDPIQYSLRIGPAANAGPDQARCNEGASTAFPLSGLASPGLQPVVSTTWSVVAGSATIDDVTSLVTTARVASGTATLRLTAVQANGCSESDDIVLTVANVPTCSITGSSQLCPLSTNQFQAPAGMSGYAWTITGNGSISGVTNSQTVKVVSGGACGATFTLNLLATAGICSSACSMDVLVADTTTPTLTIPPDLTLECPAITTTNVTGVATAQDDCGKPLVAYADVVTSNCANTKVIARTWTATDHCGNSTNAVQTIVVRDVTPPTLILPASLTLECPANTTPANTGTATSQDGCGAVNVTFSDVVSNSCAGAKFIARTWTAVDACGNVTNGTQLITVRDTIRPTLVLPPNMVLDCPATTTTNNTGVALSQDGCGSVTVSFSDSVSNNCGGTSLIKRLWTATDQCGNSTNGIQTITVRDLKSPSLVLPPSVTLECPADTSTNNTGSATAQDGCSAVVVSYNDVVTSNCANTKVIARTWTAVDGCGNATNAVQTITVRDSISPSLILPPNLTLECPAVTTTNNTGIALAQDGCGTATLSFSDVVSNSCGGTKVISRKWLAVDQCGNSTNAIQTITVRDMTSPTLVVPANVVLECPSTNTSTNFTGVATSQDGCGSVTITYSDNTTTNCGGTRLIARLWTAIDQCGNSTNGTQLITIRDTLKPSLIVPPNIVLECPATTTTNNTGVATAVDGCSKATITYSDSVSNSCGGTKVISRLWTATDDCGNSTNATQTITVKDTLRPTLVLPPDVVLDCPATTTTNSTGVALAQDGCGSVTVTFSDSVSNNCGATSLIKRLWTATDQCGNSTNGIQTITVRDLKAPSLIIPASVTLECPANTSTNNTGSATAQDGCSAAVVSYNDVVVTNCANTKVIARTWTAIDACGNATNAVQTITVRDTVPPSLILPPNLTLECPAVTTTNTTGVATAQDGCGTVTVSFSDVVSNSCAGAKVISRNWLAVDQCGNSTNRVQTITVRDMTPPTLVLPANVVLECPSTNTMTNFTGVATAQDGCGSVTITYSDSTTTNCGGTTLLTRRWTAVDQCGNSTNGTQLITVRDTLKPSLIVPANVVLECPASTTTNNTGIATAIDGCSKATVTYSDSVSNSCGGTKVISRLWTATDDCGNSTNKVQLITLVDTHPPTITAPPNLVLDCPANLSTNNTGVPITTDGCSSISLSYSDSVSNYCGGTKVVTRTWTATDACGNAATTSQTITVRDITPPTLRLPVNVVLQCPGDTRTNITGVPLVTDGCGAVALSYSDVVSNSCALTRTVQRLWTATDQCGNTTNGVQIITVVDTTKPTISLADISVQCVGAIPPALTNLSAFIAAGGSVTDSCSSSLTFALVSDSGLIGKCPGTVTRVYRATDACGNSGDLTHRITVDDTIAPVLACPPAKILEYGLALDPTNTGPATATDNCSTNVTLRYSDSSQGSQYNLSFLVADPDSNTGPYAPTYMEFAPANMPVPESARLTGRALDPLRNAVAFAPGGQQDALTSIGNVPMAFGQIVPFEMVIQASGGPGPERGTVEFSADWHTYTTSNNRFGYDTNYMVYAAFVDAADPGSIDPNGNARVESYSSVIVNQGTVDEAIRGTFRVTGINPGDRIVVEIWVVLDSSMPDHSGGTVAASFVSAQAAATPPVPISVGNQTDSLGNLSKIFSLPPPGQQPPLGPLPVQPPALPGETISVITRNWTATDDCGNQSSCSQQITVRDSAAPQLIFPPNLTLECPADTSTNNTGAATAIDASGVLAISYSDTVSNKCAGTRVVLRRWTATDIAGNSGSAVQTITVQDSKPPVLTMPANLTVQCLSDASTNNCGIATAKDGCSQAVVSYADATTTNSGSILVSRTWTAVDTCGNVTNAVQTILVRDTIPPTVAIAPISQNTMAGTSWSFSSPTATDNCGPVTLTVLSTTTNTTGTNALIIARTWLATDAAANTNTCCQTIVMQLPPAPGITTQPISQVFGSGTSGNLAVVPSGTGPFSYQWRLNGTTIPGATGSTLNFSPSQYANAGIYDVLVTGPGGTVTSKTVVVNVFPVLRSQLAGKLMTLSWDGPFVLQSAINVKGPYLDIPSAASPFSTNIVGSSMFFRLRSQSALLSLALGTGTPTVNVSGSPGENFIVQASSDLVHWTDCQTNTLPTQFIDTLAGQSPSRFYRAILAK